MLSPVIDFIRIIGLFLAILSIRGFGSHMHLIRIFSLLFAAVSINGLKHLMSNTMLRVKSSLALSMP